MLAVDLRAWPVACVFVAVVCLSIAQNPCELPDCQLGSYCFNETGIATCIPCGLNNFGVNCNLSCHCLNNEFCNKTNGHCSNWKCERGYTGLPDCQRLCSDNTFGIDCAFTCHCPENDNCSIVNGDCGSGRCHPEWGSSGCQRRLPKLLLPPKILDVKCDNITLEWNAFNETFDIGNEPVGQYRLYKFEIQSNPSNNSQWQLVDNINVTTGKQWYIYSVTRDLVANADYSFRVDAVGSEFNKLMSQISSGIASNKITNKCPITPPNPAYTTRNIISRKVFDQINIVAENSSLIRIAWVVLDEVKVYQYNVTLTWQLLGNGDCDNSGSPIPEFRSINISASSFALPGLLSWSTYQVSVNAVSLTADIREFYMQNVTTLPVIPIGVISSLNLGRISSTEAELSWDPVPCNETKGPLSSYEVIISTADSPSTKQLKYITLETKLWLANLIPYTKYSVQICYVDPAGVGPSSQALNFTTLEGVPGPVQISHLAPTCNNITVSFQPPAQPNGILVSFTVTYNESSRYNDSSSVEVYKYVTISTDATTSGNLTITVQGLMSDTVYRLRIAASTSKGIGQYGTENQAKTLSCDTSVYLVSRTNSCLTIGWNVLAEHVGNFTSFVLEVKKASADVTTPPIKPVVPVTQNSSKICELKSSTLYTVTLYADGINGLNILLTKDFSTVHGTPPTPEVPDFVRSDYTNITIAIQPVISPDVPITGYVIQVYQNQTGSRQKRFAEVPGYVTALLSSPEVTKRREFVVGDGKSYGGYENKALFQNSSYMIYYIVLSSLNNDTTATWSQLKTPIKTVPFDSALAPPVSVSLNNKNMTCLTFSWDFPQELDNFLVEATLFMRRTSDGLVIITEDVLVTTRSYQQCNLTPFTLYTVDITAKTIDGRIITTSETFITEHNTPRTPAAPVFVSSSYTSITVAIEPVVLTDAPLTAYQLQVENVTASNRRKRVAGVPGYVAAQLTKDNIAQKINFVIGDGHNYSGYVNIPLDRDTLFKIHYVVISTVGNITKNSFSSLNPPARTVPYIPSVTSKSDKDIKGVLIGVIVALVLLVLLIILLIFFYWWWRRRNRFIPYELQKGDMYPLQQLKDNYNPEEYWSTTYDLKHSRHIIAGKNLVYIDRHSSPLNKDEVLSASLPKVSFYDEFHNLPHKSKQATDNQARQNNQLNRFPHLLPYDHSLVKLKPDDNSQRTYINASFIPGYKKTPAYIAAQSPYDEDTVLDFWRLIYQKSIKTVVMITNVVEDNIIKCTQYWPDDTKASYGHFLLHLTEVTVYADYVVRTVEVRTKDDELSKIVKLFEFTSWPDHGVPDDPIPLLDMQHRVRCHHKDEPGPILVHCGTGMGRSGVFIAVDALSEQYAAEGKVMVFDFVRRMRKDRPFMVRTVKHYVFIYEALFDKFHAGSTLVNFDLKDIYHKWTQKNPRTGHTYLRDQYQLLESFTRGPGRDEVKTALLEINVDKNRYLDVLPSDKYRPELRSTGGSKSTNYINALFLDGYLMKNQFIITQTPLLATVTDFWKMVYDYDVYTIVMVENWKNEDNTCVEYWSNNNAEQLEPFIIETTVAYQHDNITLRSFRLQNNQQPREPARLVMQFQFNAWAQASLTPQSKTMIMDLIDNVLAWQEKVCQNKKPIIVHCQDGSTHSGLFAILTILCEKIKKEKEVDVFKTIKHCKKRRTQFIADYDQLRFCYKTLWDYINLRMPGGLLTDALGQNKNDQPYGVASLNLSSFVNSVNSDYASQI